LGFKGTISEYELVLMHNRLERGRLHKAKRCALIQDVPCGYVKLPTAEVARDPDEQAQATVQMVFDKLESGPNRVLTPGAGLGYAARDHDQSADPSHLQAPHLDPPDQPHDLATDPGPQRVFHRPAP